MASCFQAVFYQGSLLLHLSVAEIAKAPNSYNAVVRFDRIVEILHFLLIKDDFSGNFLIHRLRLFDHLDMLEEHLEGRVVASVSGHQF